MSSGSEISPVSETPSSRELSSGIDYDYAEEYDNEPQISSYIVDDSVRGEWRRRPKHSLSDVCLHEQSQSLHLWVVFLCVCMSVAYPVAKLQPETKELCVGTSDMSRALTNVLCLLSLLHKWGLLSFYRCDN